MDQSTSQLRTLSKYVQSHDVIFFQLICASSRGFQVRTNILHLLCKAKSLKTHLNFGVERFFKEFLSGSKNPSQGISKRFEILAKLDDRFSNFLESL